MNASERRASIEVLLAVAKELGYEAREHSYDDGAHVQLIIAGHDVELGVRFRATATDYLAFYGAVLSVGNSGDRRLFTSSAVMRAMREKAARS